MPHSAFDIIGPSMIGPSSSHTAGAVRIGLVARALLDSPLQDAVIELHGSFAATGKGHATDRALVAGLLGFAPDDERLKDSLDLVKAEGISVGFSHVDLGEEAHPNTARIRLTGTDQTSHSLTAASIGGGTIEVQEVDGFQTSFGGQLETLILWHLDKPGFLAKVTALLACVEANIATIRTSRQTRGHEALTVLEVDAPLPSDCLSLLARIAAVRRVCHLLRLS
ncbi:MAG: L-serine ammonia-lyase, iron-sulfur-dependent subunit beta [Terrimicrobiaceae bacterium]